MQQNNHDGAQVPFTVYHAQAIQELDAEYRMWSEMVYKLVDGTRSLRFDLEKYGLGI